MRRRSVAVLDQRAGLGRRALIAFVPERFSPLGFSRSCSSGRSRGRPMPRVPASRPRARRIPSTWNFHCPRLAWIGRALLAQVLSLAQVPLAQVPLALLSLALLSLALGLKERFRQRCAAPSASARVDATPRVPANGFLPFLPCQGTSSAGRP